MLLLLQGKVEELVGSCASHASFAFDEVSTSTCSGKACSHNVQQTVASGHRSDTHAQGDQQAASVEFGGSGGHSKQGDMRALKKGYMDPAAVQYLASMKLLRLAGVSIRQHQLTRTIILPG
jgi:hypothetical protein